MPQSLLVTGASGFVGQHFVLEAARRGFDTTAVGRGRAPAWMPDTVRWIAADLCQPNQLDTIAREYWGVAHFANLSLPAEYQDDKAVKRSIAMTANLVAHLRSARLLFPSSCHVYSVGNDKKAEGSETVPAGRYGQAKLQSERLILSARHIDARVARPFNHIGQHMRPDLMLPSLVARVREVKVGDPIIMAGKNSIRDFLDVRDIVHGYFVLLAMDDPAERTFNICSGSGASVEDLANLLLQLSGKCNSVVFQECARSADDTDQLVGDPSRIFALTDWQPRLSLEDSLNLLLGSGPINLARR